MKDNNLSISGKRLAGIDFGLKRTGIAVCDEMHITVTPKLFLENDKPDFWKLLTEFLTKEKVRAVVVGMPVRYDGKVTDVIEAIGKFCKELKEKTNLEIYMQDESFSTISATQTMLQIGKSKKNRRQKGNKDMIAASIILRDFLNENEG